MQKDKALEMALGQIEKQYGKGAIMLMGDAASRIQVSVIPTGCIELDAALGVGGVPRGRIVEIYGPESSGKTTIALHIIAEAQKMGGMCVFIDAEHALDPVYAEKLGISMDKLYVSQPDNGEQALDIADALVRSGAIDVIVVDSVAALVPKAELEGDMGDSHADAIIRETPELMRQKVRVKVIGNTGDLPEEVWHKLEGLIHRTAANTGVTLVLALSYGARWEIVEAARRLMADYKAGKVTDTEEVTDELFARYLTTAGIPDPDLLIRTSGECRLSNFLLWQCAYTEFYFIDKFWPDFEKDDLYLAIRNFQQRERRFGMTGEQIKVKGEKGEGINVTDPRR